MQCTGNETQGKMRSESALCMTSLIWDLAVLASSGPHSKFVSPVAVPSLTVDGVIHSGSGCSLDCTAGYWSGEVQRQIIPSISQDFFLAVLQNSPRLPSPKTLAMRRSQVSSSGC